MRRTRNLPKFKFMNDLDVISPRGDEKHPLYQLSVAFSNDDTTLYKNLTNLNFSTYVRASIRFLYTELRKNDDQINNQIWAIWMCHQDLNGIIKTYKTSAETSRSIRLNNHLNDELNYLCQYFDTRASEVVRYACFYAGAYLKDWYYETERYRFHVY